MRDEVTIKREELVKGEGDFIRTWTISARGSGAVTNPVCRIQADKPEEAIGLGLRGDRRLWRIYFDSDPDIDVRDRVYITEAGQPEYECIVVEPSFQWDNQGRLWRCRVQQYIAALD